MATTAHNVGHGRVGAVPRSARDPSAVFYGWWIVGGAFLIYFVAGGLFNTGTVYFKALAAEFGRTQRGRTANEIAGLPTMLRICVAAGELSLGQNLLDEAAAVSDTPLALHVTTTARAILAEACGRTEEAAALYAEAAAAWDEWGSVPERAYALLGLGRCGDENAAREAAAIFERLRAVPFTALAA